MSTVGASLPNSKLVCIKFNNFLTAAHIFMKEFHRLGAMPVDIAVNIKCFQQDRYIPLLL